MGSTESHESEEHNFPSSGKPIAVRVQCSHNGQSLELTEHAGCPVTSDWTALQLHVAIERLTGVHRQCQQLMFAGRMMDDDCTILRIARSKEDQLPEILSLFLVVDQDRFPQKLGPFRPVRVPFEPEDFQLPELTKEVRERGFYWQMRTGILEGYGLCAKTSRLMGQVSPAHPITMDGEQREAMGVQQEASTFVWSYPVSDWERLESDAYAMGNWQATTMLEGSAAMKSFLSVGGYLYLSDKGAVLGVSTLGRPQDGDDGGLHFGPPEPWAPEWTAVLFQQGRFQNITILRLQELGAKMYCWLGPDEVLVSADGKALDTQPVVPHGGFVYLFHEDVLSTDPSKLCLDRYFPVLPKAAVTPAAGIQGMLFRPFSLVDGDPLHAGLGAGLRPDSTDALIEGDNEDADSDDGFAMTTPGNSPAKPHVGASP